MEAINLKPEGEATPIPRLAPAAPGNLCGQCRHGITISKDLREPLECRFAPPTAAAFLNPGNGQVVVYTSYPRVNRTNPACVSGFAIRLALQQ